MKHAHTIAAFAAGICVGSLVAFGLDMVPRTPSALELSAIAFYEAEAAKSRITADYLKARSDEIRASIEDLKRKQAMDGLWQEDEIPLLHMPEKGVGN